MNILQRNPVALSSIIVVILIIMSFSVDNVQSMDQVHFNHQGTVTKNLNADEIFVAKSGDSEEEYSFNPTIKCHSKVLATGTDAVTTHHYVTANGYRDFQQSTQSPEKKT